jgi:hypothetical protein
MLALCPAQITELLTATDGATGEALTVMVLLWEAAHGIVPTE